MFTDFLVDSPGRFSWSHDQFIRLFRPILLIASAALTVTYGRPIDRTLEFDPSQNSNPKNKGNAMKMLNTIQLSLTI